MIGQEQTARPAVWKWIGGLLGGLVVLMVVFLVMLIATDPSDNLVVDAKLTTASSGTRVLTGTVRNTTERSYRELSLRLELVDEAGEVVGQVSLQRAVLVAGGAWTFEVPITVVGVVDFRASVFSPDNTRPSWLGGCAAATCSQGKSVPEKPASETSPGTQFTAREEYRAAR